jgi:hypothetical protein
MNQQSKLVGITFRYRDDKDGVFERLRPEGLVNLRPDPDNKFDKNRLAVEVRVPHPDKDGEFFHIGFLPATDKESAEVEEANIKLQREVHEAYERGEQVYACVLRYSYWDDDIGWNDDHRGKLKSCMLYVSDTIEGARDGYKEYKATEQKPARQQQMPLDEDTGDKIEVTGTHYVKGRNKYRRITSLLGHYEADGKEGFDRIIMWAMQQGVAAVKDKLAKLIEEGYSSDKIAAKIHEAYKKAFEGTATGGTDIHEFVEAWIKAKPEDRDDATVPVGFLNWWNKYQPEVIGLETRVFDDKLNVAGTYDFKCWITIKGKRLKVVVDWKSSKAVRNKHKMQAGFYGFVEEADESWVVAFGSTAKQGFSLNRQTFEQCAVQYKKIGYLCQMLELEKTK